MQPKFNPNRLSSCSHMQWTSVKLLHLFFLLGLLLAVAFAQQGGGQRQCPRPESITASRCRIGCIRRNEQGCFSCNRTCNGTHSIFDAVAEDLHACTMHLCTLFFILDYKTYKVIVVYCDNQQIDPAPNFWWVREVDLVPWITCQLCTVAWETELCEIGTTQTNQTFLLFISWTPPSTFLSHAWIEGC